MGTSFSTVVNPGLRSSVSLGAAQPSEAEYQALIDLVEAERKMSKSNRPWLYKPYDVDGRRLRRAVGLVRDGESCVFAAKAAHMQVGPLKALLARMDGRLLAGYKPRR
jgi:hypothetical protein